jgi:dTMP kinase
MGSFIAIEGGDGSGKGTQATLIAERLTDAGYNVLKISFPRYGETSAEIAGKYLDGEYGAANDLHPDLASLPFSIDRYAAKQDIVEHLQNDKSVVISDRYVASNLAHQGTKLADGNERRAFYERISNLEFGILALPQPDISIVLLVPSDVAQANVDKKAARTYTDKKRDIHEEDAEHLDKTHQNYVELVGLYPEKFTAVECMKDNSTMRTIEEINDDIWQKIMGMEI